jgi:hypothetical protein
MTDPERIEALRKALKEIGYSRPMGPIKSVDKKTLADLVEHMEDTTIQAIRADNTAHIMAIRAQVRGLGTWDLEHGDD